MDLLSDRYSTCDIPAMKLKNTKDLVHIIELCHARGPVIIYGRGKGAESKVGGGTENILRLKE